MVLLSLIHLATKHLRVFYFNLRVVENVIVVVYVFLFDGTIFLTKITQLNITEQIVDLVMCTCTQERLEDIF